MLDPFRRNTLAKVRTSRRDPRGDASEEPRPLDPVALCIAVWLGLIVAGTGLVRLAGNQVNAAAAAGAAAAPLNTPADVAYYANFTG